MVGAFVIVVIAVGVVGVLGALVTLLSGRRTWESYGRDGLLLDSDAPDGRRSAVPDGPRPAVGPAADAERDAEIRQLVDARNARRIRRGQEPLDVDAEVARLTAPGALDGGSGRSGDGSVPPARPAPAIDDALRAEIRSLVIARNARRARRGEPPLDVETEVARQIAELGDGPGRSGR